MVCHTEDMYKVLSKSENVNSDDLLLISGISLEHKTPFRSGMKIAGLIFESEKNVKTVTMQVG